MKRAEFKCRDRAAEVFLYDEIGSSWGEGISAKMFIDDLNSLGDVDTVTVRINSPGGNVFDGDAMYNALVRHPADILIGVDGLAASAASMVAMAGRVTMAKNALMMIHDPWVMAWGTAKELRDQAEVLDKIAEAYVRIYSDKAGEKATAEQVKEWMAAETWFSAEEAVAAGLADELAAPMRVAAMVHPDRYRNAPRDILSDMAPGPDPAVAWRLAAARRELMLLG